MNALSQVAAELQHDLNQIINLIDSEQYAGAFESIAQYRGALREFAGRVTTQRRPELGERMEAESITWIPVSQQLPDSDVTMLLYCESATEPVWLGYYDGTGWHTAEGDKINPSHYASLPGGPA